MPQTARRSPFPHRSNIGPPIGVRCVTDTFAKPGTARRAKMYGDAGGTPVGSGVAAASRLRQKGKLVAKQKEQFEGGYTVVFDLDETLVSNRMPGFRPAARRPFLDAMLKGLKGKAELVLWTASIESVGRPVLTQIDPEGEYFDHAIFRNPMWFTERPMMPHTKDLRLLGRDLSKVIIVENNPFSVRLNKSNAVLVKDFDRPNPGDPSLRNVEAFLAKLITSGQPVQQYVTSNLTPMRLMRSSLGIRLPPLGSDPFYYI